MIYISAGFDLLVSDYCRHKTFTEFKNVLSQRTILLYAINIKCK